jgi:hypothetical protein
MSSLVEEYVDEEDTYGHRNAGYDIVINNHTYFHRAIQIFERLNLHNQAADGKAKLEKILCQF